jgi:hypothetical protein
VSRFLRCANSGLAGPEDRTAVCSVGLAAQRVSIAYANSDRLQREYTSRGVDAVIEDLRVANRQAFADAQIAADRVNGAKIVLYFIQYPQGVISPHGKCQPPFDRKLVAAHLGANSGSYHELCLGRACIIPRQE